MWLNESDYFHPFHSCEAFSDTANNMSWCKLQRVNVTRVSLSGRLDIQHQSVVSLWQCSVLRQRSAQTKVLSKCTTV